jgi:large subunit ribosomal protein L6
LVTTNMSRLGKQPIQVPQGVEVSYTSGILKVKGPKGELTKELGGDVTFAIADGVVNVTKVKDTQKSRALWGTYAAHLHNMIKGVTEGFTKILEIEGVGYKADAQGNKIKLSVGFSHPVELTAPAGIAMTTEKGVITVVGIDKEVVGQFAADIRKVKKPEPYKGKGIHYRGEYIIRKQGKKGTA